MKVMKRHEVITTSRPSPLGNVECAIPIVDLALFGVLVFGETKCASVVGCFHFVRFFFEPDDRLSGS